MTREIQWNSHPNSGSAECLFGKLHSKAQTGSVHQCWRCMRSLKAQPCTTLYIFFRIHLHITCQLMVIKWLAGSRQTSTEHSKQNSPLKGWPSDALWGDFQKLMWPLGTPLLPTCNPWYTKQVIFKPKAPPPLFAEQSLITVLPLPVPLCDSLIKKTHRLAAVFKKHCS